jgi:GT2 family glycosyltransferase
MKGGCPVSVIIVNYNAGDKLCQCVASVFDSCQGASVIVVDNASTDNSVSLLETRFPDQPRLDILRNERNLGFAIACNMGTRLAEGQNLLYLNPDCRVDKKTIPTLLAVLRSHPDAGMVGGLLLNPDGTEQAGGRRAIPTPWRTLVRVFNLAGLAKRDSRLFSDFNLHRQALPDQPIEVEAISGACMLVRREALAVVGGFDEGYFLHCEDLDWCMRFRQAGWKVLFVPHARVTHYRGTCSRSRPVFVEWHKHRGMMRFYRKHFRHQHPCVLMWLVGAGVWLRFGLLAAYFTVRRAPLWSRDKHG